MTHATTWAILGSWVLVGCGTSNGGTGRGAPPPPAIRRFQASPGTLPPDGGTLTLTWDVADATSLTAAPGIGSLTPVDAGTRDVQLPGPLTLTLTATGPGGTTSTSAPVALCDPAPGTLTGTCHVPSAGQCIDFSGLGATDAASLPGYCAGFGGTFDAVACPAVRVGTCTVPPLGPRTGVACSTQARILEHYDASRYTTDSARAACVAVPGATFVPD